MTHRRKRIVAALLAVGLLYVVGLALGNRRLAWAAMRDLRDRELVTSGTAVTIDRSQTSISASQEAYLLRRLHESPTPTVPLIHIDVRWNAYVCARVNAGLYIGDQGAEGKETLFVCIFGVWLPVYTFYNVMA